VEELRATRERHPGDLVRLTRPSDVPVTDESSGRTLRQPAFYGACALDFLPGWAGTGSPSGWARRQRVAATAAIPGWPWGGDAGAFPGHDYAERLWLDGAPDRGGQHDRLAVYADRDLGRLGVHGDLTGGEHGQSPPVPAAYQFNGLPGPLGAAKAGAAHSGTTGT
jgi:hypothetical protein